MILSCQHCKLDFNAEKRSMKYCSKPCYHEAERIKNPGNNCRNCGIEITGKRRTIRTYCSAECHEASFDALRTTSKCKHCCKEFSHLKTRPQPTCSHACAASGMRALRNKVVKPKPDNAFDGVQIKKQSAANWEKAEVKYSDGFVFTRCPSPGYGRFGEITTTTEAPRLFRDIPLGALA